MERRNFIKITGSSALIVGAGGLFVSCNPIGNSGYEEELKEWSFAAFDRFVEVWNFNDFWKRGNTFDACLNFVAAVQEQWPDDPKVAAIDQKVKEMCAENLVFFNSYDPGGLWADDFGWWGLLALNARKHLTRIGEEEMAEKYLKLSVDLCWEYKKNTAYDHNDTALPVAHGCRNGDANGHSMGVKNTVTNVLLFLLSTRIYTLSQSEVLQEKEKFLDMAYKQWKWFNDWFMLPEYEYLKDISSGGALVQERPMAFIEGSDYIEKVHPTWAEGWVWTGDQGMLVAALTDMLSFKEDLTLWLSEKHPEEKFDAEAYEESISKVLLSLGQGIRSALIGEPDGIIREAPCYSSFGPEFGRDYLAGRGIMMRYLGDPEQQKVLGIDINDNIKKTATAIWETRETSNNQFAPEFTSPENDKLHQDQFKKLWGFADDLRVWSIDTMVEMNKNGVCQSIGLDALGAAIKNL